MITRVSFGYVGTFFSLMTVWFWSNFFVQWSHFRGVPGTIRLIRRLARTLPKRQRSIEGYLHKLNLLLNHMPFLFPARKQGCLIRGFLLFFYGKRFDMDVRLCFGAKWSQDELKTHCWILEQGFARFEVTDVIKDYVVLVEYN